MKDIASGVRRRGAWQSSRRPYGLIQSHATRSAAHRQRYRALDRRQRRVVRDVTQLVRHRADTEWNGDYDGFTSDRRVASPASDRDHLDLPFDPADPGDDDPGLIRGATVRLSALTTPS
jgi:hypothetical protein